MTRLRCALCDSEFFRPVVNKETGDKSHLFLYRCKKCGLVFTDNKEYPASGSLYAYYGQRLGMTKEELYEPINEKRYIKLLADFTHYVKGRRILDVGCGQGQFLDACMRSGWDATGIELSKEAANLCCTLGLPVRNLDVHSNQLKQHDYDVITAFEVLEHLGNPVSFMKRVNDLLVPGGIFYATTPNFDSLERFVAQGKWRVIHPEHRFYFNSGSLATLVRQSGFRIMALRTLNFDITVLSNNGAQTNDQSKGPDGNRLAAGKLRLAIEGSILLRSGKYLLNVLLDMARLGSTINILCQKNE